MKKIQIVLTISFIAIIIVGSIYFFFPKKVKIIDPINYIPESTIFFVKFNQYNEFINIFNEIKIQSLEKSFFFKQMFEFNKSIDTLLKSESLHVLNKYIIPEIFIIEQNQKRTGFISTFKIDSYQSNQLILEHFKTNESYFEEKLGDISLFEWKTNNFKQLYFCVYHNLLIIGNHKGQLASYIALIASGIVEQDRELSLAIEASGKNVSANIFVKLSLLSRFFAENSLSKIYKKHRYKPIEYDNCWISLDVNKSNEGILLSGLIYCNDTIHNQKQKSGTDFNWTKQGFNSFFLNTTAFFYKPDNWVFFLKENQDILRYYNLSISNLQQLKQLFEEQVCVYYLDDSQGHKSEKWVTVLKVKDSIKDAQWLDLLNDFEKVKQDPNQVNSMQRDSVNRANKLAINALTGLLFQGIFLHFDNQYYLIHQDQFIVAENEETILNFLKREPDSVWTSNPKEILHTDSEDLTREMSLKTSLNSLEQMLGKWFQIETSKEISDLDIELSISSESDIKYIFLKLKKSQQKYSGPNIKWKLPVNCKITQSPQFLSTNMNNPRNGVILFTDTCNNVYCTDSNGDILWQFNAKEPILSQFYSIDYFKNNKKQIMFNTSEWIYLIDMKGLPVEGFPVRLINKATNGMLLIDPSKSKNYRIYIACNNGKVYCLDQSGKKVTGWTFDKKVKECVKKVEWYSFKNKDYLVISATDGLSIVDRKGKVVIKPKKQYRQAQNSKVFLEPFKNSFRFVTTTSEGKIWIIYKDGRSVVENIVKLSPDHYFKFEDFDSDRINDYIVSDSGEVWVYTQDQKEILYYNATIQLKESPELKEFRAREKKLLINVNQNFYLLEPGGTIYEGFPVSATTNGTIIENNNGYSLFLGNDNYLYNYYFR